MPGGKFVKPVVGHTVATPMFADRNDQFRKTWTHWVSNLCAPALRPTTKQTTFCMRSLRRHAKLPTRLPPVQKLSCYVHRRRLVCDASSRRQKGIARPRSFEDLFENSFRELLPLSAMLLHAAPLLVELSDLEKHSPREFPPKHRAVSHFGAGIPIRVADSKQSHSFRFAGPSEAMIPKCHLLAI